MVHRNRWFTGLPIKNGGSFHGYVSHNQRVAYLVPNIHPFPLAKVHVTAMLIFPFNVVVNRLGLDDRL